MKKKPKKMTDLHPPTAAPLGNATTARLDLRRFEQSDLDDLAVVFAHREIWQFPYGRGFTHEETRKFLRTQVTHWDDYGFGCWAARELATGRLIGFVGISIPTFLPEILPAVEVGWRFEPTAWGHGYAIEGARAALDQAFTTMRLDQVCSVPQADNPPSARVADRLGMRLVRSVEIPAGERRGALKALLYEINRDEWPVATPVRARSGRA